VILHPSVLALVLASALTAALLVFAARWSVAILRRWDLASGASLQLELERRTYLVSTVVGWVLAFEVVSLFLFVHTADALAPLFTGAMCAAGTLKANAAGYPVLVLKLVDAVLAGLWLVLNHADSRGFDYPLVRPKYALLLGMVPPFVAEAVLQARYFAALRPEVITSCCGSLFGRSGAGIGADLAALPPRATGAAFLAVTGGALVVAVVVRRSGRGAAALGVLAALALPVGLAAVIAFVSPYVYELPTHHCPFCLLQREYGYVGYPMYAALFAGAVAGMGAGILAPFRRVASLRDEVPALQRRLAGVAAGSLGALVALVLGAVARSSLRM
jgi:hypothetical protein